MKMRLFPLFVLAGFSSAVCAQITTSQLSLKDTSAAVLYRGVQNKLFITGMPDGSMASFGDSVLALAKDAKSERYIYSYCPSWTDRDSVLRVTKDGKELFRKKFSFGKMGDPIAKFGNLAYTDTLIRLERVLEAPYVHVYSHGSLLRDEYVGYIWSYTVVLFRNGDMNEFRVNGRYENLNQKPFDDSILKYVKTMKKGDRLIIEDVRVSFLDRIVRSLNGFHTTIL